MKLAAGEVGGRLHRLPRRTQPHKMNRVVTWLQAMGLQQFAPASADEGYDDLAFIDETDAGALAEMLVEVRMKPGHATKVKKYVC